MLDAVVNRENHRVHFFGEVRPVILEKFVINWKNQGLIPGIRGQNDGKDQVSRK